MKVSRMDGLQRTARISSYPPPDKPVFRGKSDIHALYFQWQLCLCLLWRGVICVYRMVGKGCGNTTTCSTCLLLRFLIICIHD